MYKLCETCTKCKLKRAWNLKCIFSGRTDNVQTIQKLYNYLNKTAYLCFLCIQTMYKLYKTYTTSWLKLPFYVFCMYMQCTNYTKCIQMLIVSHVVIDVCFLYTKQLYILYFFNFCANNDDNHFRIFSKFQDQFLYVQNNI